MNPHILYWDQETKDLVRALKEALESYNDKKWISLIMRTRTMLFLRTRNDNL